MASKVAGGAETAEGRDEAVEGVLLDTLTAAVKKLVARGKERGYVTYDELNAALPSEQVSSEMIEDTMAMLNEIGINVVESEESEDGEAAAEKPAAKADEDEKDDEESGGNVDEATLGRLVTRFGVPIATGENACTAVEFARTIPHVTYPQPSVTKVGGVTEFLKVVDLAARHGKTPMPHSPYFGPGYWATLQIAAARPACGLFEYLYITPESWLAGDMPVPAAGAIHVPDGPGLGCTPDPEVLARFRAD